MNQQVSVVTLREQAREIASLVAEWLDLRDRASAVLARTASSEFRIAVVGEFKRGKSTLLNALVGLDVLPTGVLPVTAVPIELAAGDGSAVVTFDDGSRRGISLDELDLYTTESQNPGNRRGVVGVELGVRSALLELGLTFVDVPGMGSVHEGATDIALATYEKIDGAVLVLSADAALSAAERRVACRLADHATHLFVVVNKCDRLGPEDVEKVRGFVADALERPGASIYCLSAREAIHAGMNAAGDFPALVRELERFVAEDLAQARNEVLARELSLVVGLARERAGLELVACELEGDELNSKVQSLEGAISRERARFEGDRRAIATEVATLATGVRSRLLRDAEASFRARRHSVVEDLPREGSFEAARRTTAALVESIVREELSTIWDDETAWLEREWTQLADRRRAETEARLAAVGETVTELFSTALSSEAMPEIERRPEESLYYFATPMSVTDGLLDPLQRLIPASLLRHRLEVRAVRLLHDELTKHAGRAGAALDERLQSTWRGFDRSTSHYLEHAISDITVALERAVSARGDTGSALLDRRAHLQSVIAELDAVAAKMEMCES